ncbi:hypothetical protein [Kitasatospora purpeofusca]|uniref:hypothetical protein n=1 Tax=Kitasatospora purpeofusca TaxID=67352 RepID=UPI00365DF9B9
MTGRSSAEAADQKAVDEQKAKEKDDQVSAIEAEIKKGQEKKHNAGFIYQPVSEHPPHRRHHRRRRRNRRPGVADIADLINCARREASAR